VIQRPFKLVSLNGHDPLPGHGQQKLHSDFGGTRGDGRGQQTNALWMLDDLTAENGPTRVVPGSHRWPDLPQDKVDDLLAPHPQETYITGPAGSVQQTDQRAYLRAETEERLSEAARYILDV